jgi:poly(hydroxyalkanoate) depolymerase family esterase
MIKSRISGLVSDALRLALDSDPTKVTAFLTQVLPIGGAPQARSDETQRTTETLRQWPTGLRSLDVGGSARPLGDTLRALKAQRGLAAAVPDLAGAAGGHEFGPRFTWRTEVSDAGALGYRLYVPANHDRRELSLVLMLHGCTQNPDDFALGTQMNTLADEFGLVVAYPHQPRKANASGCWNWFDPRHQRRGGGEPAKLAALAQSLAQEFGIRNDRIFAAGLSAGGAMAEILAETYPDVFAAVAIHSGLAYQSARDVPSAFAAMKGTSIGLFRVANDNGRERQSRKIVFHGGSDVTVHPSNAVRILESAENDRALARERGDGSATHGVTVLRDANARVVVELWSVEGGGHAWFGGDPRGSYTQTIGVDASRMMVRFFLA